MLFFSQIPFLCEVLYCRNIGSLFLSQITELTWLAGRILLSVHMKKRFSMPGIAASVPMLASHSILSFKVNTFHGENFFSFRCTSDVEAYTRQNYAIVAAML